MIKGLHLFFSTALILFTHNSENGEVLRYPQYVILRSLLEDDIRS